MLKLDIKMALLYDKKRLFDTFHPLVDERFLFYKVSYRYPTPTINLQVVQKR
jgi:hypothetical protein